jgi:hypothetical protein
MLVCAGLVLAGPVRLEAQARPLGKARVRPAASSTVAIAPADSARAPTRSGARDLLGRRTELALTDEQVRVLDAVARRYEDQYRLLPDDASRRTSRVAEDKEVAAVLTAEQREQLRKK